MKKNTDAEHGISAGDLASAGQMLSAILMRKVLILKNLRVNEVFLVPVIQKAGKALKFKILAADGASLVGD